jgi:hypothetical protein
MCLIKSTFAKGEVMTRNRSLGEEAEVIDITDERDDTTPSAI